MRLVELVDEPVQHPPERSAHAVPEGHLDDGVPAGPVPAAAGDERGQERRDYAGASP